jgi:hypothetical protein
MNSHVKNMFHENGARHIYVIELHVELYLCKIFCTEDLFPCDKLQNNEKEDGGSCRVCQNDNDNDNYLGIIVLHAGK